MVAQAVSEEELDETLELVHSACHQVISGTGKVNRGILRKALSSLGHALGYASEAGEGARSRTGKADMVWKRGDRPAVAIAIDRGLRVSLALALLDTGAPKGVLVVASGRGDAWRDDLEAFRRAAIPSRGGALRNGDIHVVLLNMELEGDYVVEAGDLLPLRHFSVADLLEAPDWEAMGWLREEMESASSVEMGGGAQRDYVDRSAYRLSSPPCPRGGCWWPMHPRASARRRPPWSPPSSMPWRSPGW
jgi:hypothetical protein